MKIVNVYPDNHLKKLLGLTSAYLLFNGDTGEQIAILHGNANRTPCCRHLSPLAARLVSALN